MSLTLPTEDPEDDLESPFLNEKPLPHANPVPISRP